MKYRKKPIVVEAFRLPAIHEDAADFLGWADYVGLSNFTSERDGELQIQTFEGTMSAFPGDWIIRGIAGEFYPCKDPIFRDTYEKA